MKQSWKPGTVLYPLPAVLVSCGAAPEEYNMLTVAWTGTVCSDPPMCFISVRPERHSHAIISRTGRTVWRAPQTGAGGARAGTSTNSARWA